MTRKASNPPGSERRRDEDRAGGPRMHGRGWHDHEEPRELEPEVMAAPDAVPEVEAGGEREGMGRGSAPRKSKDRTKSASASPRGKAAKRRRRASK